MLACAWGLLLGSYTGVLLNVTNAPSWSHDPFLPVMFLAGSVATGAAAVFLIAQLAGRGDAPGRARVLATGTLALGIEVLAVAGAVLAGIGSGASPFFTGWWAALFWLLVLPVGLLAPLWVLWMAQFRGRHVIRNAPVVGAGLLLLGVLLLRMIEVFGGQAYFRPY
ncbi:MAG: polysulfide reductase NrfD [Gemmatimonadetes bacterium]|nr:polysulfide reductase NrfD [Gemmatimonadota bacterium]